MEIRACREKEPDDTEARGKKGIGGGVVRDRGQGSCCCWVVGWGGISKVRGVGN